jgi:hypothetical protein
LPNRRRPVVLASLAIAAASAGNFLLAKHTAWLFPARILSGLAIALASGASTAWITELEPRHNRSRATRFVIAANLMGLGLGALLAGLRAQDAIWLCSWAKELGMDRAVGLLEENLSEEEQTDKALTLVADFSRNPIAARQEIRRRGHPRKSHYPRAIDCPSHSRNGRWLE